MIFTNDTTYIGKCFKYYKENQQWIDQLCHHVHKGVNEFYKSKNKYPDRVFFSDVDFPDIADKKIYILGIEVMATPLIQSGTMICVDSHALTIYD